MSIQFSQIPDTLLVPGQYQEIDNSLAGKTSYSKKVLLVASYLSNAIAKEGKVTRVTNAVKAAEMFGYGSPMSIMAENFLTANKQADIELYALPIAEAGIAYEESFVVTVKNAENATVKIKTNDKESLFSYLKTDTAEKIAAKISVLINSIFNSPITAESEVVDNNGTSEIVLKIKSVCKGVENIQISFEADNVSFTSKNKVEAKYEAVSDWKKYFTELGNTHYNYFILGFEDVESLKSWSVELEDRYSATRQIGGRLFGYLSGVVGDVAEGTPMATEEKSIISKAEKVNSPHIVLFPYTNIASLPFSFTTKIAGVAITALSNDPAANTYSLAVTNILATSEISTKERDALLNAGVATFTLDYENNIRIERLVTSYKRNANGERDTSYLDIQVVETVEAIRTYINNEAKKRFKGWKLANTEEWFGSGSKVMTPSVFKSFLAELYRTVFIEQKQWTQDFDSYKKSLRAEVKTDIKTRLEYNHCPILIGQFYQAFGFNQFK